MAAESAERVQLGHAGGDAFAIVAGNQRLMTVLSRIEEPGLHEALARAQESALALRLARYLAYAFVKRVFDVAFAASLLIALVPLMALIAALIRLASPGPVLFRQQRCGLDGRLFTCYKFRTMVPDAEVRLQTDTKLHEVFAENWKLDQDPRVTPVGRVLRRTSLDETPQLLNILRGDMSVVGPRPVQPRELRERYGRAAHAVVSVKPGLTGLWQVSGRSAISYAERVALDLEYVRRCGFLLDLMLILKTIPALLFRRGAV